MSGESNKEWPFAIEVAGKAPDASKIVFDLVSEWLEPAIKRLDADDLPGQKIVADPVWQTIELSPYDVLLLDTPLMQRLRGIKQLGLARLVYPSATHDRFAHSLGVLEACGRMIDALEQHIKWRAAASNALLDTTLPPVQDRDRASLRLAALLHDCGHGPLSHVTESLVAKTWNDELASLIEYIYEKFSIVGDKKIAPAEALTILFVASPAFHELVTHPRFAVARERADIPLFVAARVLGSPNFTDAPYLSGLISGPIDADKLDYMARDSHFSGFPLTSDFPRLIRRLQVIVVTDRNAPTDQLKTEVASSPTGRLYKLGISTAALGAYELLLVNRIFLYDRLYYHHKIRAAESMLRRSASLCEADDPMSLEDYLSAESDDVFISDLAANGGSESLDLAAQIAESINGRRIHKRAFICGLNLIRTPSNESETNQKKIAREKWQDVLDIILDEKRKKDLEKTIADLAKKLSTLFDAKAEFDLSPDSVIVDYPGNGSSHTPGLILTQSDDGHLSVPALYFRPEEWSEAYRSQKQRVYVFAPVVAQKYVAMACYIIFANMRISVATDVLHSLKLAGAFEAEWASKCKTNGLMSEESLTILGVGPPTKSEFRASDFDVPKSLRDHDPDFLQRLSTQLNEYLKDGVAMTERTRVAQAFSALVQWVNTCDATGCFQNRALDEAALQDRLSTDLRMRDLQLTEQERIGGGKSDLILFGDVVVENKEIGEVEAIVAFGEKGMWQARRYRLPLCTSVGFTIVAYKPKSKKMHLSLVDRIEVVRLTDAANGWSVQIRLMVPYGFESPSVTDTQK